MSPRPARPVDRLFALYALAAGLALAFPHRPPAWPLLAAAHLAAAALALRAGPAGRLLEAAARRWPRAARTAGDWYPLLLLPLLYTELAVLNQAVHGGRYFDALVQAWEERIFGGQPSRVFWQAAPSLALSELLHGAYLSYYFLIYLPPLALYRRAPEAFGRLLFPLLLTFFVHYLFFIYLPVQGPRYLFPPPDGPPARGALYALAHRVLEAGSSRGAAFPSSHVAVAVAQTLLTARLLPRLCPAVALLTVGLAAGAVYGGFHYATDVAAGAALGAALVALAPALERRLAPPATPRAPARAGTAAP